MITNWHMIPLCIGTKQIAEIEVKYDLTWSTRTGWKPVAVLVEDLDSDNGSSSIRIEMDGTVADGSLVLVSLLGPAIVSAAHHYYDAHRDDVLEEFGLLDAAE